MAEMVADEERDHGHGTASSLAKKVSVLDSIHMLNWAWANVKSSTITNCFRKAFSFSKNQGEEEEPFDILADVTILPTMNQEQFESLVDKDIELSKLEEEDYDKEDKSIEVDEVDEEEDVSSKECLKALEKVCSHCQKWKFNVQVHQSLRDIEIECLIEVSEAKKDKRITDFFKYV